MIADSNGNKCYDADFHPWGEEQVFTSTCGQNYKFSGKERDPDMSIDDFGARFYKSSMARFYSPDWSADPEPVPYAKLENPQTLNLYTYVADNPTTLRDPDGHDFAGLAGVRLDSSMIYAVNVVDAQVKAAAEKLRAQNQAQLNIQVIRSDNLSNSGQAAVNGQLSDMKADMAKIGIGVNITSDSTRSNIDLKNPGSFDKGAIPYFFVTSKEAGSSTSGSGFFGKKAGVVINEFANGGDKVVATHETLHILRGDIYAGKNGASWGRELHVRWETFKLEHGWTGGMGWLTDAARNPPNQ